MRVLIQIRVSKVSKVSKVLRDFKDDKDRGKAKGQGDEVQSTKGRRTKYKV